MKPEAKNAGGPFGLPNNFAAVRTACRCFDIRLPKLEESLQCMRSGVADPDQHFPQNITRVMLNRAEAGNSPWIEGLGNLGFHAIYDRILREDKSPRGSIDAHFSENLVRTLLIQYERIAPKLRAEGIPRRRVNEVLIRELFVPTFYAMLARRWEQVGRGNEFHPDTCWYLPRVAGADVEGPFPRVLKIWMKCAGFRYAHDIGKQGSPAERRKVENWLKGRNIPEPQAIRRLIDRFHAEAEEIDTPESWKSRLVLASAMHRLCDMLDAYFIPSFPRASLRFTEGLREIRNERIAIDSGQRLLKPHTFFAARLLQRRWQKTGEWESKVLPRGRPLPPQPLGTDSDEVFERYREEVEWRNNPGNLSLAHMRNLIADRTSDSPSDYLAELRLDDDIVDLGIAELSSILNNENGR